MAFMFYEIYTYNCKYKIKILEHDSNLWLWICCRQLPLSHCIATTKQFTGLFCLRQITAAFHYCNAMSQVRELCRVADRNKKAAHRAIFFWRLKQSFPWQGNVMEWQKGDCEVRAARTCDFEYVVGNCRCLIVSPRQNNSPDCFVCDR